MGQRVGGASTVIGRAVPGTARPNRVNANRVRACARACGQLAKTDQLDAQALSRYAAAFDLTPDPVPDLTMAMPNCVPS